MSSELSVRERRRQKILARSEGTRSRIARHNALMDEGNLLGRLSQAHAAALIQLYVKKNRRFQFAFRLPLPCPNLLKLC